MVLVPWGRNVVPFQKGIWAPKAVTVILLCEISRPKRSSHLLPRYESVFGLLVFSVNIFFVLLCSIWPSYFLNFEWDSGVQRREGEQLWLKLGLRKPPPFLLPSPQGPAWEQWKESKWDKPRNFPWLFFSQATHFVFGFVALCLCKEGSCHLSLCTDTVAQLKKKRAASEQICFYMDLIRYLPGAQFCAWCCQDMEDLWDTAFDFRGCQHAIDAGK